MRLERITEGYSPIKTHKVNDDDAYQMAISFEIDDVDDPYILDMIFLRQGDDGSGTIDATVRADWLRPKSGFSIRNTDTYEDEFDRIVSWVRNQKGMTVKRLSDRLTGRGWILDTSSREVSDLLGRRRGH